MTKYRHLPLANRPREKENPWMLSRADGEMLMAMHAGFASRKEHYLHICSELIWSPCAEIFFDQSGAIFYQQQQEEGPWAGEVDGYMRRPSGVDPPLPWDPACHPNSSARFKIIISGRCSLLLSFLSIGFYLPPHPRAPQRCPSFKYTSWLCHSFLL